MSRDRRLADIEKDHPRLSVRRQCCLLSLTRSTFYATPVGESAENLVLMRVIDEQFLRRRGMARGRWLDGCVARAIRSAATAYAG